MCSSQRVRKAPSKNEGNLGDRRIEGARTDLGHHLVPSWKHRGNRAPGGQVSPEATDK